jgi:cation-transporting ATPase F
VAIGNQTQTGRISELVEKGGSLQTPLTRKFEEFSLMLLRIILSLAGLTFLVGLAQGQGAASVFEAAVALAVSAIPEGLPAGSHCNLGDWGFPHGQNATPSFASYRQWKPWAVPR